ncbi:DUF3566 domain-containing protein [Mycobacterium hubeiense]|uniref:DUF3566 domain-containing protein n=1 Tax=Mycobacterium hubeiense TaxID=1867256 RepID=UPI000C7F2946|nr:DUF3566 domain-containing protein [Mycobacterium sp. QGD 101]
MTSPSEPGHPRTGERPASANGSTPGSAASEDRATARIADAGDVPPWQRGASRAASAQSASEQPARGSTGVDERLNRFMSGTASSADEVPAPPPPPLRGERSEHTRTEVYASELPDLSGPVPRPPQRRTSSATPEPATRDSAPTTRIQVGTRHQGPVRASMQIRRIDPWSVLKVSLVLSVALFFVWMIAVAFLYLVLGGMGVWSKLNSNVGDLLTSASGSTGGEIVSSGTIFGGAMLIGLVNIVLLSAMATIGAFIYNLTTDIVGGIEVTLADRD